MRSGIDLIHDGFCCIFCLLSYSISIFVFSKFDIY